MLVHILVNREEEAKGVDVVNVVTFLVVNV